MANLSDIIGTDYIGNTNPVIQLKPIRGTVVILDVIKDILKKTLNKTTDLV